MPVLELLLTDHLYHLILHRSGEHALAVLAVVVVAFVAFCPVLTAQEILVLSGTPGVFLGEQPGAPLVGPGIVSGLHLGLDDLSGEAGEVPVWRPKVSKAVGHVEPSELPPNPLKLGLLL